MKTTKCPYCPTCSLYGLEAVEKYGAIKVRHAGFMENYKMQSFFQKVDMIRFHSGGILSVRNVINSV